MLPAVAVTLGSALGIGARLLHRRHPAPAASGDEATSTAQAGSWQGTHPGRRSSTLLTRSSASSHALRDGSLVSLLELGQFLVVQPMGKAWELIPNSSLPCSAVLERGALLCHQPPDMLFVVVKVLHDGRPAYALRSIGAGGRALQARREPEAAPRVVHQQLGPAELWRSTPGGGLVNVQFHNKRLEFQVVEVRALTTDVLRALEAGHMEAMQAQGEEMAALAAELGDSRQDIQDLLGERERLAGQHKAQVDGLTAQLAEAKEAAADVGAQNALLRAELARLEQRVGALSQEKQAIETRSAALQQEAVSMQGRHISEKRRMSQELDSKLADMMRRKDRALAEAHASLTAVRDSLASVQREALRKERMRATLEESLMARDGTLAGLVDQNQRLDFALKTIQRQVAAVSGAAGQRVDRASLTSVSLADLQLAVEAEVAEAGGCRAGGASPGLGSASRLPRINRSCDDDPNVWRLLRADPGIPLTDHLAATPTKGRAPGAGEQPGSRSSSSGPSGACLDASPVRAGDRPGQGRATSAKRTSLLRAPVGSKEQLLRSRESRDGGGNDTAGHGSNAPRDASGGAPGGRAGPAAAGGAATQAPGGSAASLGGLFASLKGSRHTLDDLLRPPGAATSASSLKGTPEAAAGAALGADMQHSPVSSATSAAPAQSPAELAALRRSRELLQQQRQQHHDAAAQHRYSLSAASSSDSEGEEGEGAEGEEAAGEEGEAGAAAAGRDVVGSGGEATLAGGLAGLGSSSDSSSVRGVALPALSRGGARPGQQQQQAQEAAGGGAQAAAPQQDPAPPQVLQLSPIREGDERPGSRSRTPSPMPFTVSEAVAAMERGSPVQAAAYAALVSDAATASAVLGSGSSPLRSAAGGGGSSAAAQAAGPGGQPQAEAYDRTRYIRRMLQPAYEM